MNDSDEIAIHKKMQRIEGKSELKTEWGKIIVVLDAIPNYAGGKGCPDEILSIAVKFTILGTDVELSVPILIEGEKGGYSNAVIDLKKFCERSISGEQTSYLEIPMIIIGGGNYRKLRPVEKQVKARFSMTQIPRRMID